MRQNICLYSALGSPIQVATGQSGAFESEDDRSLDLTDADLYLFRELEMFE